MNKITITMDTTNAAFEHDPGSEVARILRKLAEALDGTDFGPGRHDLALFDINGNDVGHAEIDGK